MVGNFSQRHHQPSAPLPGLLMISLPRMPEHMSGHDACMSQRLRQRVDAIDVGKEAVRYRGLEHTGFDDQVDGIIVVQGGDAGVAGYRSELEKEAVRISSGALIPINDHEPGLTNGPAGGGAELGCKIVWRAGRRIGRGRLAKVDLMTQMYR